MAGTNRIAIRRATIEDAAFLADLAARLFDQTFGAQNTAEDMEAFLASTYSLELQREEIADPDRVTFLAVDDGGGSAIGFAMVRRGPRANGVIGERPVEVQRIYVDRESHGSGVGASLMNSCVEQARAWKGDVLWLGVFQKNPRAIAFYKRQGFAVVGVQQFMVGSDLQDDYVMARPL